MNKLGRAYIVTGPASTGSVFISKVIAQACGLTHKAKCGNLGYTLGLKPYGCAGKNTLLLHISQPYRSKYLYCDLKGFRSALEGYDLKFVLTTRDRTIIDESKVARFPWAQEANKHNYEKSKEILRDIIRNEKYFIWSYETMIYLDSVYFDLLYEFLEISPPLYPDNIKDGNKKYITEI